MLNLQKRLSNYKLKLSESLWENYLYNNISEENLFSIIYTQRLEPEYFFYKRYAPSFAKKFIKEFEHKNFCEDISSYIEKFANEIINNYSLLITKREIECENLLHETIYETIVLSISYEIIDTIVEVYYYLSQPEIDDYNFLNELYTIEIKPDDCKKSQKIKDKKVYEKILEIAKEIIDKYRLIYHFTSYKHKKFSESTFAKLESTLVKLKRNKLTAERLQFYLDVAKLIIETNQSKYKVVRRICNEEKGVYQKLQKLYTKLYPCDENEPLFEENLRKNFDNALKSHKYEFIEKLGITEEIFNKKLLPKGKTKD